MAVLLVMAACGGGDGGSTSAGTASGSSGAASSATGSSGAASTATASAVATPSPSEAARFLTQATFGPNQAEIDRLSKTTYAAWLDEQFAKPQTLHRLYVTQAAADLAAAGQTVSPVHFINSWWSQAITGDDQLRQRAAFALSEIMVISFTNDVLRTQPRGVASYYDMLGEKAFGNFRDLLEAVSLHPMMGIYLTSLKNEKEDPTTGRVPDLNFAREITQLFAVGEYQLNLDGTPIMGADGRPTPAYKSADLEGLSQVFTGWSWYAGPALTDRTNNRFYGKDAVLERDWRPMQAYNNYAGNTDFHSVSVKKFWNTTIAAQDKSDTEGDMKIALDALFNNPNVGPFIGKQLIQRLVTSNPSPAYVKRVASVFNDNGKGVRGDMKSVWKAILLDPEARTVSTSPTSGKLREPVVRMANFLRAFNATSASGRFIGIGATDDPALGLGQTVMYAPTVFNFFRPGYVPTSKAISDANVVVPELQITNDVSVAGYMNFMSTWVQIDKNRDIVHDYSAELKLADTPADLVDRMNLMLFSGTMPDSLRASLITAVTGRTVPMPVYGTSASSGTYTKVADEGGSFTTTGSQTVRYGANGVYLMKTVTGMATCSNDFFGGDPVVGTVKVCEVLTVPVASAASAASAPVVVTNQAAIDQAKLERVYLAVYLSMSAPDYLVQK